MRFYMKKMNGERFDNMLFIPRLYQTCVIKSNLQNHQTFIGGYRGI
jgi:hypothetical protein